MLYSVTYILVDENDITESFQRHFVTEKSMNAFMDRLESRPDFFGYVNICYPKFNR